jgi:hypothetical protein
MAAAPYRCFCEPAGELAAGSVLARGLEPLPVLPLPAPTSLQGGSAAPLTFVRRVKTSGYGAVKPYRPSWAAKSAAAARGVENGGGGEGGGPAAGGSGERYPPLTPPLTREDAGLWEGPSSAGAAQRGASVSATGRMLTVSAAAGGARVAGAPQSCASLAAGALGAVALSSCGSALAVGGVEGVLSAVVQGGAALGVRRITRHCGGSPAPFSPLCWSAAVYPGLVPRLAQASAAAAAAAGGRGRSGGELGGAPSRLLLGLVEGGAALWAAGAAQPLLALKSPAGGDASGGAAAARAGAFPAPPSACALCYMDRLVALSTGRRVYIYSFSVSPAEEGAGEDVGAAQRRGEARRYACCAAWDLEEEGVHVVALAAMNDLRSPYLLATCSDKSLRVWDLSAAGGGGGSAGAPPPEVLRVPGAHARAIHTLALPLASAHAQCPSSSLDSVLTASAEGGGLVRLWDLRSAECARQLAGGHVSRTLPTGAALSPCATFVACGSEERRAVVYDLRTEACVERHAGASDAVTAVAWHPRRPTLFAGSADGGLRAYVE